jgi:hypothetical protein
VRCGRLEERSVLERVIGRARACTNDDLEHGRGARRERVVEGLEAAKVRRSESEKRDVFECACGLGRPGSR